VVSGIHFAANFVVVEVLWLGVFLFTGVLLEHTLQISKHSLPNHSYVQQSINKINNVP